MERLTFKEFLDVREEFDAAVLAAPAISKFCSSSGWAIPAFTGLNEFDEASTETFIIREADSWVVFVERSPNFYYPFESAWMFQCPLIGSNATELLQKAKAKYFDEPKGFVIGGIPTKGTLDRTLAGLDSLRYESFPTTDCMIIDLSDGMESWLSRRSKRFRRTMRDARKKCAAAHVVIEDCAADFDRLLAIQQQTSKWKDGSDILHHADCLQFYKEMIQFESSQLHFQFRVATIDGEDVAFLLGATLGKTFRGLQMSYIETHRNLGLGNFLQLETLRLMSEKYGVVTYDLGMFSEYKSRWADETRRFSGCFVAL